MVKYAMIHNVILLVQKGVEGGDVQAKTMMVMCLASGFKRFIRTKLSGKIYVQYELFKSVRFAKFLIICLFYLF